MTRPALFLDRDGVINVDHGYVHKVEDFEFVDGIFELVAAAQKAGYLVVVVTNQAGIGRGYYKEADFHSLMDWVRLEFVAHGGQIDAVYFCPFHPDHGLGDYRRDSEFRKPAPGMLLQASKELGIDLESSIFVGDNLTDMQAGLSAGVGSLLHLTDKSDQNLGVVISRLTEVLPYLKPLNR